ncbi:2-keto-4-pentenoate hydratase [Nocardia aurantiaca]|uniref:4-oxalocrotonate decarboxylase n=1 Tax=Nocardia aurantiaca TaxID=2675850 RepID=A0A6I3L7H4_9NOCA|nr:fumarylacetoacetate hydrolase family protein [Nocardia aurantiaca]MTE17481.1 4-oxalocrotonate decarboxylase [Nocardia aurantiaca]
MSHPDAVRLLVERERLRHDGDPLTVTWPDLDVAAAYGIQTAGVQQRLARGQRITGIKLGLTSRAKQRAMGVSTPLTGWLTDTMALSAEQPLPVNRFIHPRVEPEIVFVMARRLAGPGVTAESALAAVAEVRAGVEVIDSRFRDFRFTLADVIADNASAAGYYLGIEALAATNIDVVAESCRMRVDGTTVGTATGAAVLGNPAEALALAANALSERGYAIEAGWIVLTGGLVDAARVVPGNHVHVAFATLGSIDFMVGA